MDRKRRMDVSNECSSSKKNSREISVNESDKKDEFYSFNNLTSTNVSIEDTPIEVLAHILSFISPRERRNFKLVCQKWHEAGSFLCFSRREKIVFRNLYNVEEMLSLLSKTRQKFLNLEFHNFKLDDASTLMSMREKIYFLSFVDCELNDNAAYELIVGCKNLQLLRWHGNELFFTTNLLNLLTEKRPVIKNLKILELFAQKADISNDGIRLLFSIFPNVRQLTFHMSTLLHYDQENTANSLFSFSAVIDEVISLKYYLEKLKITLHEPQWRLIAPHHFTRLKEISIFIPDNVSNQLIFNFFSGQEHLERISCTSIKHDPFATCLFEHIIYRCLRLKHLKLKFRISCVINLSREMFQALVSSNLVSLKILNADIKPLFDSSITPSDYYFFENWTLNTLSIPLIVDRCIQLLFILCFKNLRHLELQCVSASILEAIGKFQRKLISLKLNLPDRLQSDLSNRLSGRPIDWNNVHVETCLRSLEKLEYLAVTMQSRLRTFDGEAIPVSVKYLYLYVDAWYSNPSFSLHSLKRLADVEVICLGLEDYHSNYVPIWPDVCNSLPKLRQLHIDKTVRSSTTHGLAIARLCAASAHSCFEKTPEGLFEFCPSLRLMVHRTMTHHAIYYYNFSERKMKKKKDTSDFIVSDRIGDIKIKHRL